MTAATISDRYKPAFRTAIVWFLVLACSSATVLDMGEFAQMFFNACAVYLPLIAIIVIRRPKKPTTLDLLLIAWALPVFFFLGFALYPFIWHLRGISV